MIWRKDEKCSEYLWTMIVTYDIPILGQLQYLTTIKVWRSLNDDHWMTITEWRFLLTIFAHFSNSLLSLYSSAKGDQDYRAFLEKSANIKPLPSPPPPPSLPFPLPSLLPSPPPLPFPSLVLYSRVECFWNLHLAHPKMDSGWESKTKI